MAVCRFIMGVLRQQTPYQERGFWGKGVHTGQSKSRNWESRKQKSALFRIKMAFSLLGNGTSSETVVELRRMDGLSPASQIWDLARRHARPVRTPGPQGRGGEFLGVWQVPEPLVL